MKKIIALLITFALVFSCITAFASDDIKVTVNGEAVSFPDQQPVLVDGRTMVPFRTIAESLGCDVDWDADYQIVGVFYAKQGFCKIFYFQIDNPEIQIMNVTKGADGQIAQDDGSTTTDVPATIIGGRTLIPLRLLGELIDADVDWDDATKTVKITVDKEGIINPTNEECLEVISKSFLKAKHILIADEDVAKAVLREINKGEDFDELMFKYTEDPGIESSPNGYIFQEGQMVPEFEEAVKSLKDGEVAQKLVKSDYGFHIIKRVPFNAEEDEDFITLNKFGVIVRLAGLIE